MTHRNKIGFRPTIERLEQRWVPATIRLVAGNLFISNPRTATLTVETTTVSGQIAITDGSTIKVNGVGGLISITGTNAKNNIVFQANVASGNKAFNGNLLINSGNGDDVIDLSGQIGGNVTILTGFGNDTVQSTSQDVKIGGSLSYTDTYGKNEIELNNRNYTIGGNFQATGIATFDMGGPGNLLSIGGNATVTSTFSPANAMTVTLDGDVDVGKTLQITGSSLDDTVTSDAALTVGGNAFFSMGNGTNTVNLAPTGGFGVSGSLQYQGGTGNDDVDFGADFLVAGNASLYLGEGDNTFDTVAGAGGIFGNLLVNGGNGSNTVTLDGLLSGTLNLTYGNGANFTSVNVVPPGLLTYRGGNGSDDLILRGVGNYLIDATFGTGTNLLDIDQSGLFLSGVVRGTGGTNSFIQGDGVLLAPFTFINFP